MNKIVYFDVQNYEKEFLKKHNEGKYDYHLESNSLNNLNATAGSVVVPDLDMTLIQNDLSFTYSNNSAV